MFLNRLSLQNFRNYSKSEFNFNKDVTLIVGPNTSGKTNIIEAVYLLSIGKSFRADKDFEMIRFGEEVGRVGGEVFTFEDAGSLSHVVDDTRDPSIALRSPSEIARDPVTGFPPESSRSSLNLPSSRQTRPSQGSNELRAVGSLSIRATPRFLEEDGRSESNSESLEVVLSSTLKKFLVNGVSKRRVDFSSNLATVLFSPQDLDIIIGSPGLRRKFLDEVLEQVDRDYRLALVSYSKALRQRNALLEKAKESGRNERQFEFWDEILIKNGEEITSKREKFITFINSVEKDIFDFTVFYDKSILSKERLLQYKDAEIGAGVTLVGPHRDDILVSMFDNKNQTTHDVKLFASRGQQRLVILQLKLLQLLYIEKNLGERPVLLLDDIFSELDEGHIHLVLEIVEKHSASPNGGLGGQTIMTTTHKEFFEQKLLKNMNLIELSLVK